MWSAVGIWGRTPQLVLERLVSVVQRRLELIRAGANKAEQSKSWSDHRDELPSSCEQLPNSVNRRRAARTVAEQCNQVRLAIRV